MTGTQLLSVFNEIVLNDLYPVAATTTVERLFWLNQAKREIFRLIRYPATDVSVTLTPSVQTYSLNTLPTPLFQVTSVKYNETELDKEYWYQVGESITFVPTIVAGNTIKLTGFMRGASIVEANQITDLPEDLQIPIVYLAIYNSCGSQEDDNAQLNRLQSMVSRALDKAITIGNIQARADFPF
jgi:hypothetical protein